MWIRARGLLAGAGVKRKPGMLKGIVVNLVFNLGQDMAQRRGTEPVQVEGKKVKMGPGEDLG